MKDFKPVCHHCGGEIKYLNDLVVVSELLNPKPITYHDRCYVKNIKKLRGDLLGGPINTFKNTVLIILYILISIIFLFLNYVMGIIFLLVASVQIYFRLYSWFKYEKKYFS
ncbi:hypothetical protein [Clostridiisalibacter paucivorans]|uniref:hypothetical protein n=1 Tax=Clostridiisalibacter paucivorans TaxID=408753 RepID=UPI00047D5E0C|nr:hypothetical protein [Clostridiisalibacter paucivorans]